MTETKERRRLVIPGEIIASGEVYLPGLYCNSALTVSFIDSVVPKNKAKIFLDDNEIEF